FHPGSQTVSTEFGCARADCPRLWDEHKVKREASIPHCVYLNKQRQNTANAAASKKVNPKKRKAQTSPGNSAPAPNAKKSKTALTADNSSNTNALSARKRKHRDESDESDDEVDELQDDTEGELDEDSSYRKRMRLDVAAPLHACSKDRRHLHPGLPNAEPYVEILPPHPAPDPSRSQSRSALYDWPRENEELYRDVEFTFGSPIIEETLMQEYGDGEQQNEESQDASLDGRFDCPEDDLPSGTLTVQISSSSVTQSTSPVAHMQDPKPQEEIKQKAEGFNLQVALYRRRAMLCNAAGWYWLTQECPSLCGAWVARFQKEQVRRLHSSTDWLQRLCFLVYRDTRDRKIVDYDAGNFLPQLKGRGIIGHLTCPRELAEEDIPDRVCTEVVRLLRQWLGFPNNSYMLAAYVVMYLVKAFKNTDVLLFDGVWEAYRTVQASILGVKRRPGGLKLSDLDGFAEAVKAHPLAQSESPEVAVLARILSVLDKCLPGIRSWTEAFVDSFLPSCHPPTSSNDSATLAQANESDVPSEVVDPPSIPSKKRRRKFPERRKITTPEDACDLHTGL
ncbi:hypothetical protein L226DRAFT_574519, partial [Lentinus tigrinus ALCF2SS1-7]|uniref:uncharacterized protein n=1 Tax=Lentinus tigrinus ALCF2SS1-7 TaxID=1328758 RepID=UPI001165C989